MVRFSGRKLACVCLVAYVFACVAAADNSYERCLIDALESLQQGDTSGALTHLKTAMKWEADDALLRVALGAALLMGARSNEAAAQFNKALQLDPRCAEAAYGKGLALLASGRAAESVELMCKAHALDPTLGADGAIRYIKWILGSREEAVNPDAVGECDKAIAAYSMMAKGKYQEAKAMWTELETAARRPGFGEQIGFLMTFDAKKPLAVTGCPLPAGIELLPKPHSKLAQLSGIVALKADVSRIKDIRMVAFFVDNKLVGLTNQPPYQYMWDTTRVSNGPHTIKIVGTNADGFTVSEKTTYVIVQNAFSGVSGKGSSEQIRAARLKIRELMRLRPSFAGINVALARCAEMTKDFESAVAAYERAMAANPDHPGLRHAFAQRCANRGVRKVYRVPTESKLLALTFDDGPNSETPALLDLLREKGVKATFFVVGKRAEEHPELLKRMAAEGHEIQNHTYNHRALDLVSTREIEQEIYKTAAVVRAITGKSVTALRPPGGRSSAKLEEVAGRYGCSLVFWTANCTSLEGGSRTKLMKYLSSAAEPGAIVLMHNAEGVTMAALPKAIDAIRAKGFEFATLEELAAN